MNPIYTNIMSILLFYNMQIGPKYLDDESLLLSFPHLDTYPAVACKWFTGNTTGNSTSIHQPGRPLKYNTSCH